MHFYQLLNLILPVAALVSALPDKRQASFHVHLCGIVLFWTASGSTLKEIIINWTWDMVAESENVITISMTGTWIPCILFSCCLLKKTGALTKASTCTFCVLSHLCECFLLYVRKHAWFVYFEALNAETHCINAPIITMWDWLFDCFQGVSAKSLFCDYYLIICPPKRLSSTVFRFLHPGLSGGWVFDWQLVNDVISILLGKWSVGETRLDGERGDGNLLRLMRCGWWMAGWLQERGTARLSCLRWDWKEERRGLRMRRVADEPVWLITCTWWLMGQHLIAFADTCSAVWLPFPKSYKNERWLVVRKRLRSVTKRM